MSRRKIRRQHFPSTRRPALGVEYLEDRRLLAVFTVTDVGDNGPGTLRDAIEQANALAGTDFVDFSPSLSSSTIHIQSQLEITDALTIDGTAFPGGVTISAAQADATPGVADGQGIRIFDVETPTDSFHQVRFDNLRLEGGDVNGNGGAIHSTTTTILLHTNLAGNAATGDGGGIFVDPVDFGGLFIEDSALIGNSAAGKGGAVMVNNGLGAYSAIGRAEITDNTADTGGGVYVTGGQSFMVIFDSYLTGNTAVTNGGGLAALLDGSGASMSVQNVVMHQNQAAFGGGVDARVLNASDMSIYNSTISDNTSDGNGGGARLEVSGGASFFTDNNHFRDNRSLAGGGGVAITVSTDGFFNAGRSTFEGNTAQSLGGGVFAMSLTGGDIRFNGSQFFENSAGQGGGLTTLTAGDALVRVANSALYRNDATTQGGGAFLASYGGTTETILNHTTVSENTAGLSGGGVYVDTAAQPVVFEHSTIANNVQFGPGDGGGILVAANGLVRLDHSIVADNTTQPNTNDIGANDEVFADYSLLELVQPSLVTGVNNIFGVDPELAPLADNGGATMTHAFAIGSAVHNAGQPSNTGGQFGDQRGTSFPRVQFGTIDIGAFERSTLPTGDVDANGAFDCDDIDIVVAAVAAGAYTVELDFDGDATVGQADIDLWLAEAGAANLASGNAYLRGDANLDGFVDASDFVVWNEHKFTGSASWCSGDFNADGSVDAADFIIWNDNRFQSSGVVLAADLRDLEIALATLPPSEFHPASIAGTSGAAYETTELFDSSSRGRLTTPKFDLDTFS